MAATPTTPAAAQKSGMAKIIKFLTKNSMTIALIAVFVLFYFLTDGRLLYAQNMSNLLPAELHSVGLHSAVPAA